VVAAPQFQPVHVTHDAKSLGTPSPTGLTPAQVRHAYGFDQVLFSDYTVVGDGSEQTIAIVDAFDNPQDQ